MTITIGISLNNTKKDNLLFICSWKGNTKIASAGTQLFDWKLNVEYNNYYENVF